MAVFVVLNVVLACIFLSAAVASVVSTRRKRRQSTTDAPEAAWSYRHAR